MLRLRIWLLLLFLCFLNIGSVDAVCQDGYSSYNNKTCYKLYTNSRTREAAEWQCELDGGYSPKNGFDNTYISSLAQQQASVATMFLGIKCFNGSKTECVNDDNSTFGPYDNFYPNNPSSEGDCVYMLNIKSVGSWYSSNCFIGLPYVCEMDYVLQKSLCPPLFHYFQGMCYQVIPQKLNATDAEICCQQFTGGNLVTIPSAEVNQYMKKLISPYYPLSNFWMGLRCPNVVCPGDTSSCVWYDNTPFSYTNLGADSPSEGYPYTMLYWGDEWWSNTGGSHLYPICQASALQ